MLVTHRGSADGAGQAGDVGVGTGEVLLRPASVTVKCLQGYTTVNGRSIQPTAAVQDLLFGTHLSKMPH